MLALYRSGRQAEALQAYRDASRVLRDELGVDPSPQLRELEGSILQQSPQLDWTPARAPIRLQPWRRRIDRSTPGPATVLIGREQQLDALEAALTRSPRETAGWSFWRGEPGIGKTRLAEEAAQRATRSGVAVAWGRCPEEQGAPPFWPWLQVLRELLADVPPSGCRPSLGSEGRS